jgi:hypothetical protein
MGEAKESADFRSNLKQTKKVDSFLEELQKEAAEKPAAEAAAAAPPPPAAEATA